MRLALGLHDALEAGVARLVDARLHLDDRRQLDAEDLVQAGLHLAGHLGGTALLHLQAHHQPGVGPAEVAGDDRAGRAVADVVGLRAGEHEVERLARQRRRQRAAGGHRVAAGEGGVVEVDGACGAERQRLAQRLLQARRAEAVHHHLAAGGLGDAQPLLQGVLVALVDDEGQLLLGHPAPVGGHLEACLGIGHLFDANGYTHEVVSFSVRVVGSAGRRGSRRCPLRSSVPAPGPRRR